MVVMIVVSVTASTTGLLLTGASYTVAASSGSLPGTITIYSYSSKLPLTSIIPISLSMEVGRLPGVKEATPEALAPVLVDNQVLILRGMNLTAFAEIYHPLFLSGGLGNAANYTVFLGATVAMQLLLRAGSPISIIGLMSNHNVTMTVGGIFRTGTVLDDEIVSEIQTGQLMRGLGSDQASLVSATITPSSFNASSLVNLLNASGSQTGKRTGYIQNSIITSGLVGIGSYLAGNPSEAVGQVLSRAIGLSQNVLWALVAIVSICSVLSIYYSVSWMLEENSGVIQLLNSMGMARRGILLRLLLLTLMLELIATSAGYLLALLVSRALAAQLGISILFHSIMIPNSPQVFALSVGSVALLLTVSLFRSGTFNLKEGNIAKQNFDSLETFEDTM
ncbi:MAG: hypothetical protein JRN68_09620 [Nitrososphaerota archaeon]|jgi:ABC-type lipoprotein release transport system permease subunit|nr:hypothetical protein [Nitrososphaerota archaeon]